jgi:hypothetical protein
MPTAQSHQFGDFRGAFGKHYRLGDYADHMGFTCGMLFPHRQTKIDASPEYG